MTPVIRRTILLKRVLRSIVVIFPMLLSVTQPVPRP
jgi:hypothetical protein